MGYNEWRDLLKRKIENRLAWGFAATLMRADYSEATKEELLAELLEELFAEIQNS